MILYHLFIKRLHIYWQKCQAAAAEKGQLITFRYCYDIALLMLLRVSRGHVHELAPMLWRLTLTCAYRMISSCWDPTEIGWTRFINLSFSSGDRDQSCWVFTTRMVYSHTIGPLQMDNGIWRVVHVVDRSVVRLHEVPEWICLALPLLWKMDEKWRGLECLAKLAICMFPSLSFRK